MIAAAVRFLQDNYELVAELTVQHLILVGTSVGIASAFGFSTGLLATRMPRFAAASLAIANIGQSIPSIAVLGLVVPFLGIGVVPALVALSIRGVLPIYLNTYLGLRALDPASREAVTGLGMRDVQALTLVEIPLASPIILAGIRTAAVEGVGIATLAAFIGAGGLGDLILQGIAMMDVARLLGGAIPAAALAISAELLFGGIEQVLRRRYGR
jgi:osmoprotectant transport system permease protein